MECGVIYKLVEPFQNFVFGSVKEYVGYIGSCEKNLVALHKSLEVLCIRKDDIKRKVKLGNDRLENASSTVTYWLHDVRMLAAHQVLKELMYKDIETAKFVVKLMEKKDLKKSLIKETKMQELVIKVMKKLKEEMEACEGDEMKRMKEGDYNKVGEVVVDVMKDTFEEFKKIIKQDKNMAVIATRTFKGEDLMKLTIDDQEMEDTFMEVTNASDEELWPNHEDDESNAPLLVSPATGLSESNPIKDYAMKLFTPLSNLLTPLGKLMNDAKFKKAVPGVDGVKLGLEVIDALLIKSSRLKKDMLGDDAERRHRSCCCSSLSLCDYHGHYHISKAAELMEKLIQDVISKCPPASASVTSPISAVDLKPVPTQFLKGLDSRTKLLSQILRKLEDDNVTIVSVVGMGGTGKTTMAKEIMKAVKDIFSIKVMVEVSNVPDIIRIQEAIGESIDLPLHGVKTVAQRSVRLYNRLILKKEVLIILDSVWKKLNLSEIGIPSTCKLLLTTRDRDVCRVMDVPDVDILEVGLMNTNEAKMLFKCQGGNQVDLVEYKNVVQRLLNKCGGLPLTIVTTATSLKDKDLRWWEKFADDLEKPILSQVIGDHSHTYSILDTSYKFIQVYEKRIFFLLACLSPVGSGASTENLIRYGIGLNLFPNVNKLSEASELADIWANDLLLSSMLIEGDVKGELKVHDIVRRFAVLFATKEEGHKFMMEGIPRWLDDETFNEYTAMTLRSRDDYSRLSGVEAEKLQILILKGDMSPNFDDSFFKGMRNLKVLAMSNMNFDPSLPESLWKLTKLRTLCMERCKLGDIKQLSELVNLLVLSLRESSFKELPVEIGKLSKLRVLDLTGCICCKATLIPTGILSRLSKLEGLYLSNTNKHGVSVFGMENSNEGWGAIEKYRLPHLNSFNIKVRQIECLPIDPQSFENIDKFRVCVAPKDDIINDTQSSFDRVLYVLNIEDLEVLERSCLKPLLKRADYLQIRSAGENIEQIVPLLDQDGFLGLCSLNIQRSDIKCIVNGMATNSLAVFPHLRSLHLCELLHLKMICDGEAPPGMFSNLKILVLNDLPSLSYGLPLVPRNLVDISVSSCHMLNFIFHDDKETQELSSLKTLRLIKMQDLLSLVGPKVSSNNCDTLPRDQFLFDGRIEFPALELLEMDECNSISKLWSKETSGFQYLKDVRISKCNQLLLIGSPFLFSTLVHLESLRIKHCVGMREIISAGEKEASEIGEQIVSFPQLKFLELGVLGKLACFVGEAKLEFPKLKQLILYDLLCMNSFVKLENPSSLFHVKIDFPYLEGLQVRRMSSKVTELWDLKASNPAPRLRHLELGTTNGLSRIPPVVLENLSSLKLVDFKYKGVLFSSSDVLTQEQFVWTYSELPKLEELKVENIKSLNKLVKADYCLGNDASAFCEQLKTLALKTLPALNLVPLHLFKNLSSLFLEWLNWEHVISADMLGSSLQQLEHLSIVHCHSMEAVMIDVVSAIELPRLKKLYLDSLGCAKSFFSTAKKEATLRLPSLESLTIERCPQVERFWTGSFFAPKLRKLSVTECNKLQHVFEVNPDITTELSSLQKVDISSCGRFKSILSGPLEAPILREVQLYNCPDLECFLLGSSNQNGPIELPFLDAVDIGYCAKLKSMSRTPLQTSNLTHVQYHKEEYSMVSYDDLNDFLQKVNVDSMAHSPSYW